MFDVDVHTMEVLIPSVIMVGAITVGMIWGFAKMRRMMNEDSKH